MSDKTCSRCRNKLSDSWVDGWPNYGHIRLGIASQAFAKLRGKAIADKEDFEFWKKGEYAIHPALKACDAQEVIFHWDGGENTSNGYHLCYDCTKELFWFLGWFFGIAVENRLNIQGVKR